MATRFVKEGGYSGAWDDLLNSVFQGGKTFNPMSHAERIRRRQDKMTTSRVVPESKRMSYFLGQSFQGVYLTQREAESVYKLVEGKTIVIAAKEMALSYRTVEYYINNVKQKLGVKKKREVIEQVLKSDFLENYLPRL